LNRREGGGRGGSKSEKGLLATLARKACHEYKLSRVCHTEGKRAKGGVLGGHRIAQVKSAKKVALFSSLRSLRTLR